MLKGKVMWWEPMMAGKSSDVWLDREGIGLNEPTPRLSFRR